MAGEQRYAGLARESRNLIGRLGRMRRWLFKRHRTADGERRRRRLEMEVLRGGDDDGIDAWRRCPFRRVRDMPCTDAIGQGFREPAMRARIPALEAEPLGGTPDEMRAMIEESLKAWGPVVEAAHISID